MINEPDGLDNQGDRLILDDDIRTWRTGEQVEVTLVTERGPGNLIRIGHRDGDAYLRASAFAKVRPVGENPEQAKKLKTLRTQVVEERLAAGTARSETAMARRETSEIANELRIRDHQLADLRRQHRLAVAALKHFRPGMPGERSPLFEQLLGVDGKPGSIAEPCNAVLTITERHPGCGCDEPCMDEVAVMPCALRRGHLFVLGKEKHRTLYGRLFEAGETVVRDDG